MIMSKGQAKGTVIERGAYPRVHLYLDSDDMDWYRATFKDSLGLSKAVRAVLKSYRKRIEAQAALRERSTLRGEDLAEEVVELAKGPRAEDA